MSGDRTILYKMKEMWSYMAPMFTNYKKYAKKIRNVKNALSMKRWRKNFLKRKSWQEPAFRNEVIRYGSDIACRSIRISCCLSRIISVRSGWTDSGQR